VVDPMKSSSPGLWAKVGTVARGAEDVLESLCMTSPKDTRASGENSYRQDDAGRVAGRLRTGRFGSWGTLRC